MSLYLDNAATSWPKPPGVIQAMVRFMEDIGANPGRAGHRRAIEAGRIVNAAREVLAEFFGAKDPLRVVFGSNGTEALNLAICGLLNPGDHVITSSVEHNSVMRPLRALGGVTVDVVQCAPDGTLDPQDVERAIRPETRLIILNHASNVMGTVLPVAEVGGIARRHDLLFLLDSAAGAGTLPINMETDAIDLLAFTGHKSLLGPMGTGGLVLGDRVDVRRMQPIKRGGTGSLSEKEIQPEFVPDIFESGTLNVGGLAGLEAGVRWIMERGLSSLREGTRSIVQKFIDGLCSIPAVT
ncbi:MAG: aminotransferase class V-fold PLP-dependent enzyme, partial [Candidatus Eisenbacteria bacterium]|nr:aminotransferase class V-fold PLP-dependent enzyme [Candidatus Eisenbacteria bacterium]